jgi:DNA polymerase delta subunit 1
VEAGSAKKSTCTYELRAKLQDLICIDDDAAGADEIAPLRVLSFDIEAAGRKGVFPQAEIDPVIQIALQFQVLGEVVPAVPILLSLRECDAIADAHVLSFESESALLSAFRDLVVAFDTDVFTGYNVCGFDFGYLQNRAETLLMGHHDAVDGNRFDAMTRLRSGRMVIRETEFFSAQMGKQRRVKVTIPGRAVLDMLMVRVFNLGVSLRFKP